MSTRATVHFHFSEISNPAEAIVYRHSDGDRKPPKIKHEKV